MNEESKMELKIIGMVWYKKENYESLKELFEDGDVLHDTYDEWLNAAETGRKKMESTGVKVICVDIDPVEFPKWCKENNMQLNAKARNHYANLAAYKAATGGN